MEIDTTLGSNEMLRENNVLMEIASSLPGVDEAMSFAELIKQVQTLSYSCIVFDTAPTGHTLRLLSFPSVIEKAFDSISSIKDRFQGVFSKVCNLKYYKRLFYFIYFLFIYLTLLFFNYLFIFIQFLPMLGGGNTEESMQSKLEELRSTVQQIKSNFQDSDITTFVCVCIPEFLSLYETERLVQELTGYGIDTQNIVVNQVLHPDECTNCRKCQARTKMQQKYLEQISVLYSPDFHIVEMPLMDEEVRGKNLLDKFGIMLMNAKERENFVISQSK